MKRSWLIHGIILLIIIAIGIGPWIPVAIASSIASANDCRVSENGPSPCIVDGVDKGDDLYAMGMMGWLGIATCPVSLGLLLVYVVVVLILSVRKRQKAATG